MRSPFQIRHRARLAPALALLIAVCAAAACEKSEALPTAPSPPAPERWAIEGVVRDAAAGGVLASAQVEIAEGTNLGKSALADDQGHYRIGDLEPGTFVVNARADGFQLQSQSVTLTANQAIDFVLQRPDAGGEAPPVRWLLSGTVSEAGTRAALPGASVRVVSGLARGTVAEADSRGHYSVSVVAGTFSVEASAEAFEAERRSVTLTSDQDLDFELGRTPPSPPAGPMVTGVTVDGVSNDSVEGARISVEGGPGATSRADGSFELALTSTDSVIDVTISSETTIERTTRLRVAGPPATLTLIPKQLGLTAFDQMFRGDNGVIRRWTTAPRVVVERRVLQFTNVNDTTFTATAAVLSDDDVSALMDDLEDTLAPLTGDTFDRFADHTVETAAEGDSVEVSRTGVIVVAHYEGLTAATSYWGYTRWAWNDAGEMRAAIVMLDRGFETSGSPYRRSLHSHELGHALGYYHVSARESVMNISGRVGLTGFDRNGARIAFLRPPLNRTPDIDPNPVTVNRAPMGGLTWTGAR